MTRLQWVFVAAAVIPMCAAIAQEAGDPLKCIQRPMVWMVRQQTRIVIETPADCPELKVTMPPEVELLDRWPWAAGDTRQRFYVRANAPLAGGAIEFSGGDYSLTGTAGQAEVGELMRGGAYELAGGFWGAGRRADYDVYLPVVLRTPP